VPINNYISKYFLLPLGLSRTDSLEKGFYCILATLFGVLLTQKKIITKITISLGKSPNPQIVNTIKKACLVEFSIFVEKFL